VLLRVVRLRSADAGEAGSLSGEVDVRHG